MRVGGLSLGKIAILLIAAGVALVFLISGFQPRPNDTKRQQKGSSYNYTTDVCLWSK
jgi:hypothetical protein